MRAPDPPTSFRAAKGDDYARAYMMDEQLAGDRRKRRIDRIQREIVVAELAKLPPGAVVADVPCGNGRLSELAAPAPRLQLVALDYNLSMVLAIAQRPGAAALLTRRAVADVLRLPLRDRSVDLLISMRLLHHLPDPPTRLAVLAELARVCRGRIITSYWTTHCWRHLRKRLLCKKLRGMPIAPAHLRNLCRDAGLLIEAQIPMRRFYEEEVAVLARPR